MADGVAADFDAGSFRDPLSRVVIDGDRVLRVVRAGGVEDLDALLGSRFFAEAQRAESVVATDRVDLPRALAESGWEAAVEHARVPAISYPFEWSFSMLQDAALGQLALARSALAEGMLTKDATPFNTQFIGSAAQFIDIGSFERLRPGAPWPAYRQFCMQFYNPLLLQAVRDVPFQPLLRGSLDGISPQVCRSMLGRGRRIGHGAFTHVVMHARLERRNEDAQGDVRAELARAGFGPGLIDAQLRRLEKHVAGLRWEPAGSEWSGYGERAHYADHELQAKAAFVRRVVERGSFPRVLDLGANDGYFSRIVADHADCVVAVDGDPLVVEMLYRELRAAGDRTITPLYSDLADPSPPMGWRSRERSALPERVRPDLVLALALVHHLAISSTVPLPEVVAMLRDYNAEVVVEFPTREDPMVQRLLSRKRDGLFDQYDLAVFEDAVASRFEVVGRERLAEGTRHLFHLAPR